MTTFIFGEEGPTTHRFGEEGPTTPLVATEGPPTATMDNGFYRARIGPDPCTGLGVPIGTLLVSRFARG